MEQVLGQLQGTFIAPGLEQTTSLENGSKPQKHYEMVDIAICSYGPVRLSYLIFCNRSPTSSMS